MLPRSRADALDHLFRYIKYLDDVREVYVRHPRPPGEKDADSWRCPALEYYLWLEVKYGQYGMQERDHLLKDCNVDFNYVYHDRKPDIFQSIDWVEYVQQRTDDPCDTTGGGGTVEMGASDSPIVMMDTVNRLVEVIVQEEEEATRRYRTDVGTEGPGSPSKVLLGKRKQDNNGDNDGEQSDSMFEAEGQGEADVEMEDQSHTDGDVQEGGSKAEGDSKARVEHAQDECDLGTSASSPIRVGRRWRSKFLCLLSSIRSRLLDQHGIDIDEHVDAPSITALLTSLGEEDQFTRRALSILLLWTSIAERYR
ncbi:hypothetical protein CONPUDRAFT_160811 [Coniophora puteana RWD-64-598 SS2]|uniref:Uncharacterized protein n=1 Tax=Coniophora puteana (strain RWD-64-598) TaxID=741705 RepID=R7SC25_CONPW|nr:uncharacterized protein CONPUDRAFT_160811 [Coniophora puteana RWD-64-598 SS2]EIW73716.1 hypothetical protein CONPUDRAFT_160811 [Coniophora puteana RWD-64-598 SS2]